MALTAPISKTKFVENGVIGKNWTRRWQNTSRKMSSSPKLFNNALVAIPTLKNL